MVIDWLDAHAGAIQGISAVALVVVTLALVWITWTYAKFARRQADEAQREVDETQRQRFDQYRPVVHPAGTLPLTQGGYLGWSEPHVDLKIQNVGKGVALLVCGVMFPPEPMPRPSTLPTRYTIWRHSALRPEDDECSVRLEIGRTVMDGDATIGTYRLFAPRTPSQQERMLGGQYNVLARLTLTYQDIYLRKHAAVFDYIDLYAWQCVALLTDTETDLETIDSEVRRKMIQSVTPQLRSR